MWFSPSRHSEFTHSNPREEARFQELLGPTGAWQAVILDWRHMCFQSRVPQPERLLLVILAPLPGRPSLSSWLQAAGNLSHSNPRASTGVGRRKRRCEDLGNLPPTPQGREQRRAVRGASCAGAAEDVLCLHPFLVLQFICGSSLPSH